MDMRLCAVAWLCTLPVLCRAHEEHSCYGPGDVAGIIIAAIVVTLVFVGLALAAVWYRRKKLLEYFGEGCLRGGKEPDIPMKPTARKSTDAKFAFDNPYFREEEHQQQHPGPSPDAAEKGQANGTTASPTEGTQQNGKIGDIPGANGKGKKAKIGNPFSVFSLQNKKPPRTMDDSCLAVEPERLVVPLRGHDFTGLGFNICGNMRDGIFVKDVLHRGPASESGKIKAGDRIIGVTVSFSKMVFEDALTILSYASPYDVQLELEKPIEPTNSRLHVGPPPVFLAGLQNKRLASSSFTSGTRLFHPLYRSQSIDDLTQIGKDGMHSPKRTQSVGLTMLQRSRSGQKHHSESDDTRPVSVVLVTGSLNERMLANAIGEDGMCKRALESLRENKGEEGSPNKTVSETPKVKCSVPWSVTKEISLKEPEDNSADEPSVFESQPKKIGKRKAPPPPKKGISVETEAQVHHTNDSMSPQESEEIEKDTEGERDIDVDSLDDKTPKVNGKQDSECSDDSLDDDDEHAYKRSERRNKKRKSSSLGDLTNIEEAINKHSTLVLERAVSLDLQQQAPMPEGTLGTQAMIPSEAVECLTVGMDDAKPFPQLTLITSTPVPERERSNLMSNLTQPGMRLIRRDLSYLSTPSSTRSDFSLSSELDIVKSGLKIHASEESFRSPLRSDGSLRSEESLRSPLRSDDSLRSPFRSDGDSDSESFPRNGVTSLSSSQSDKEVIEITESELDDVMMSHRQFLLKQAKATGVYSGLNPKRTGAGLNFESWSFEDSTSAESSPTRGPMNGSSSFESSDYSTAFDSSQTSKNVKSPEISQITLRSPDGQTTRTVVVSAQETPGKDIFGTSDSPPPKLESP